MRTVNAGAFALMLVSCSSGGDEGNVALAESKAIAELEARVAELEETTAGLGLGLNDVRGWVALVDAHATELREELESPGLLMGLAIERRAAGDRWKVYAIGPADGSLIEILDLGPSTLSGVVWPPIAADRASRSFYYVSQPAGFVPSIVWLDTQTLAQTFRAPLDVPEGSELVFTSIAVIGFGAFEGGGGSVLEGPPAVARAVGR